MVEDVMIQESSIRMGMPAAVPEVSVRKYIFVTLALAMSGLAELASLFFIQPLLPKLAMEYNIPVSQVSIILSAETALLAIGLLFTGSLADRFGRKRLILVSLTIGGLITLLCPLVHSWTLLVMLRALIGLTLSGIAAAATAYISEEVAPVVAGVVTGYFVFGNSIGGMSGRVIASQLMERVSIDLVFYLFGAILISVAIFVHFVLPASKNFKPAPDVNFAQILVGGMEHFKNKKLSMMYVVSFVIFGTFTSLYNFLSFNLHREPFNVSYANAGLVSTCFALSFFTAPRAGRLAVKYGAMNVLSVLLSIMILGMAITVATDSTSVFIVGAVIFTAAFFGCHSIGLAWVSKNATHARGQATAFYLFFYYMGGSVVGYLNGLVFVRADWIGLTAFIIALLAGAIVISRQLAAMPSPSR
jgi:MFS family permease